MCSLTIEHLEEVTVLLIFAREGRFEEPVILPHLALEPCVFFVFFYLFSFFFVFS